MERPPPRRRGTYAKTPGRRQEILRTAIEVFAASGYEGSSFREIAARVGMSETGLAHHFGGKAALLAAVLQAREEEDGARLRLGQGSIAPDRLRDLVAYNAQRRGIVQLFARLSTEGTSKTSPAHEFFTERYERLRRASGANIRRLQDEGAIRPDLDADLVAQVLLAVLDGLQIQWLYDERADMVAALDLLVDTWLSAPSGGGGGGGSLGETGVGDRSAGQ
jgi:AcrR family transcriptional regulator